MLVDSILRYDRSAELDKEGRENGMETYLTILAVFIQRLWVTLS